MRNDSRRISLVGRSRRHPHRDWDDSYDASSRILFVESLPILRHAIGHGMEMGVDVDRVVVDRMGDARDFLELITALSPDFLADVLFIGEDEQGWLSAAGRGGNRVLYSLTRSDVRFYLEAHDLVTARLALERLIA